MSNETHQAKRAVYLLMMLASLTLAGCNGGPWVEENMVRPPVDVTAALIVTLSLLGALLAARHESKRKR